MLEGDVAVACAKVGKEHQREELLVGSPVIGQIRERCRWAVVLDGSGHSGYSIE